MYQVTSPEESAAAGWERTLTRSSRRRSGAPAPYGPSRATVACSTTSSAALTRRLLMSLRRMFYVGLRQRAIWQATVVDHDWRPTRVPQLVLPVPHPNEGGLLQPLRRAGAATSCTGNAKRSQRRTDPASPRRDPKNYSRPTGPSHRPDIDPHRPAPGRGAGIEGWRHQPGGKTFLLL